VRVRSGKGKFLKYDTEGGRKRGGKRWGGDSTGSRGRGETCVKPTVLKGTKKKKSWLIDSPAYTQIWASLERPSSQQRLPEALTFGVSHKAGVPK